jgi:hypothetical protein
VTALEIELNARLMELTETAPLFTGVVPLAFWTRNCVGLTTSQMKTCFAGES